MVTRVSNGGQPDGDATSSDVLQPANAEVPGSVVSENLDAFGLPKGHALAEAIEAIAARLSIPHEHAREIALRAIATLQDEISQRGLPLDDGMARWTES